jgi:Ni/Fe-hydrogenase 1 B-type cytochrome subunit
MTDTPLTDTPLTDTTAHPNRGQAIKGATNLGPAYHGRLGSRFDAVYVYEAPVRIWHWINAFAILVLGVSGYFIGSPLPSLSGEASDHYLMGYIRFAHFAAAYVMILGFLFRIYWAVVGNRHARQIFTPPLLSMKWWGGIVYSIRWYLFMEPEARKYVGHNPLATFGMHFGFVWVTIFMIVTGLALYGEGAGMASWQYRFFSSWVIPLFGQSQDVHTWHHVGLWAMVVFIIIHIYAAIREDIMSRQSMISSVTSGWRTFKDDRPLDEDH